MKIMFFTKFGTDAMALHAGNVENPDRALGSLLLRVTGIVMIALATTVLLYCQVGILLFAGCAGLALLGHDFIQFGNNAWIDERVVSMLDNTILFNFVHDSLVAIGITP